MKGVTLLQYDDVLVWNLSTNGTAKQHVILGIGAISMQKRE